MRRGASALVAVGALLAFTACSSPPAPVLDLRGVVTDADVPAGMTWVASYAELTAGQDFESIEHQWHDSAGEPESCLPMYLVPYGLLPGDEGSDDRTVEVGYFVPDTVEGSILVNARQFADEDAAADYLAHASGAADDCAGYRISGLEVAPNGFEVSRADDGTRVRIDGGQVPDGVTTRTVLGRVDRTIIVVDAFLHEAADFDPDLVDDIATTILTALGDDASG